MIQLRYIPIRVCSPRKAPIHRGYLRDLYLDRMLQVFFKAFEGTGYALLSRKLGICTSDRQYKNYGDYEMINGDLLDLLVAQAPYYQDTVFLYWNHRPLTHSKWVKMLADAGFNVIEHRTLAEIKEAIVAR